MAKISAGKAQEGRRPIRQQVYERLTEMIVTGDLPYGADISELEMSKRLGVGRTPIREALMRLSGEGVVRYSPNQGFWIPQINPQDIQDAYEVRELIEVRVVELLCERATDRQMDELDAIAESLKDLDETRVEDSAKRTGIDRRFHATVVKFSGNRQFVRVWRSSEFVRSVAKRVRDEGVERLIPLARRDMPDHQFHKALVEMMRCGNKEKAVEMIRRHIKHACGELIHICREHLAESLFWP